MEGPDGTDLAIRPISMEEAFGRQNDRVLYLRSIGKPYGEAVLGLLDLLSGLEDEEFYDGIPSPVRKRLKDMPPEELAITKARYRPRGWDGLRIRGRMGFGGIIAYRPTPDDLAAIYRLTLGLAARMGLSWRQKRVSSLEAVP